MYVRSFFVLHLEFHYQEPHATATWGLLAMTVMDLLALFLIFFSHWILDVSTGLLYTIPIWKFMYDLFIDYFVNKGLEFYIFRLRFNLSVFFGLFETYVVSQ